MDPVDSFELNQSVPSYQWSATFKLYMDRPVVTSCIGVQGLSFRKFWVERAVACKPLSGEYGRADGTRLAAIGKSCT